MAWKTKPSATIEIQRRSEPYLTQEMQEHYTAELLPRYETKHASLLPILNDVQDRYGCVVYQAMIEIAQFLELKPADVLDTASFYEAFTTEPVGKYVIGICQSVGCEICGHQAILDHVRNKLDLEPHETTEDGKFTLLTLECLGSCDTAPVALINEDLHENLTIEKLDQILENLPD